MWPEIVARFARVATLSPAGVKAAAVPPTAAVAASPAELARYHVNALLDIAGGLESCIVGAVEAAPSPSNVINIAAE